MTNEIDRIIEEFDEKFGREIRNLFFWHKKELQGLRGEDKTNGESEELADYKIDKLKSFLRSATSRVATESRTELIKEIEGMKKQPFNQHVGNDTGRAYDMGKNNGYNQAIDYILSKLKHHNE